MMYKMPSHTKMPSSILPHFTLPFSKCVRWCSFVLAHLLRISFCLNPWCDFGLLLASRSNLLMLGGCFGTLIHCFNIQERVPLQLPSMWALFSSMLSSTSGKQGMQPFSKTNMLLFSLLSPTFRMLSLSPWGKFGNPFKSVSSVHSVFWESMKL